MSTEKSWFLDKAVKPEQEARLSNNQINMIRINRANRKIKIFKIILEIVFWIFLICVTESIRYSSIAYSYLMCFLGLVLEFMLLFAIFSMRGIIKRAENLFPNEKLIFVHALLFGMASLVNILLTVYFTMLHY